jgi:hypothetical protein
VANGRASDATITIRSGSPATSVRVVFARDRGFAGPAGSRPIGPEAAPAGFRAEVVVLRVAAGFAAAAAAGRASAFFLRERVTFCGADDSGGEACRSSVGGRFLAINQRRYVQDDLRV